MRLIKILCSLSVFGHAYSLPLQKVVSEFYNSDSTTNSKALLARDTITSQCNGCQIVPRKETEIFAKIVERRPPSDSSTIRELYFHDNILYIFATQIYPSGKDGKDLDTLVFGLVAIGEKHEHNQVIEFVGGMDQTRYANEPTKPNLLALNSLPRYGSGSFTKSPIFKYNQIAFTIRVGFMRIPLDFRTPEERAKFSEFLAFPPSIYSAKSPMGSRLHCIDAILSLRNMGLSLRSDWNNVISRDELLEHLVNESRRNGYPAPAKTPPNQRSKPIVPKPQVSNTHSPSSSKPNTNSYPRPNPSTNRYSTAADSKPKTDPPPQAFGSKPNTNSYPRPNPSTNKYSAAADSKPKTDTPPPTFGSKPNAGGTQQPPKQPENLKQFDNPDDYYKVLGVPRTASQDDIKKAYKRLSLSYHPDKHPTEEAKYTKIIQTINKAYQTLQDEEKRRAYDNPPTSQNPYTDYHPGSNSPTASRYSYSESYYHPSTSQYAPNNYHSDQKPPYSRYY